MTSVGAAMLVWYYTQALPGRPPAHAPMHAAVAQAAGAGLTLPTFRPLTPPAGPRPAPAPAPQRAAQSNPEPVVTGPPAAAGLLLPPPLARAPTGWPRPAGAAGPPRRPARDRRLAGGVFTTAAAGEGNGSSGGGAAVGAGAGGGAGALVQPAPGGLPQRRPSAAGPDALAGLLRPTELRATRAQTLPSRHLLLARGTFIDCTLETAIDSTLAGMTTCVTATDTFSADGSVVLLERGTKLIGEVRGEVRQGQARVFVVWTQARTPAGVVVRLDSPGTDALGRSGLEGRVNRHFWERFGAAALVSTLDGVVQSETQSSSRGATVVLDPSASEDVLTGILRGTIDIPPTIRVRNGARIQVLVARDVDFRPVYELEPR